MGETMAEFDGKTLLVVRGLTPGEHQSLLFSIDEEAISLEAAGIPSTAFGDFGLTALAFIATTGVVDNILNWVERQTGSVEIEFEFLKLAKLKVKKGATKEEVAKKAREAGLQLESSR
jgi:hypothetical protein